MMKTGMEIWSNRLNIMRVLYKQKVLIYCCDNYWRFGAALAAAAAAAPPPPPPPGTETAPTG